MAKKSESRRAPTRPPPSKAAEKPVYSFPNRSRCPRCGSVDTEAQASVEGVQFRRCRAAICRHGYKVAGTPI